MEPHHFYKLALRRLGYALWLEIEPQDNTLGPDHSHRHLRPVRFRTEAEVLRKLGAAQIGTWSSFPPEGIHATLTPSQLRTLGFRGLL